jgi:hypothetical protein
MPEARVAREVLSYEQEGASWDQEGAFYGQDANMILEKLYAESSNLYMPQSVRRCRTSQA